MWLLQLLEIVRIWAPIIGGAAALYLAWKRVTVANRQAEAQVRQAEAQVRQAESSARQADIGRRKLVSDLFSQAVGQLRDEKLEIRLFGIYTLRQIVEDDPEYRRVVVELLSAYLKENNAPWGTDEPPVDVREIMKMVLPEIGEG